MGASSVSRLRLSANGPEVRGLTQDQPRPLRAPPARLAMVRGARVGPAPEELVVPLVLPCRIRAYFGVVLLKRGDEDVRVHGCLGPREERVEELRPRTSPEEEAMLRADIWVVADV